MRIAVAILIFVGGCMESTGRPPELYECSVQLICGKETTGLELQGATCDSREGAEQATMEMCNELGVTECARARYFRCEPTCVVMNEDAVTLECPASDEAPGF